MAKTFLTMLLCALILESCGRTTMIKPVSHNDDKPFLLDPLIKDN